MHLGEQGDAVVRQTVDEPHLPQRSASIERRRDEIADQLAQLPIGTGSGEPNSVEVEVEVEVRIVHQNRAVEPQWNLADRHRELGHAMDATGQRVAQIGELEGPVRAWFEDHQGTGMHRPRRAFGVEVERVCARQSPHRSPVFVATSMMGDCLAPGMDGDDIG